LELFSLTPALLSVGWQPVECDIEILSEWRLARVIAQHRAGYELHDGEKPFTAQPAPRFLKHGLDPTERPAVGDFVFFLSGNPSLIEYVLPRRTVLSRAAAGERYQRQIIATNIDTVMVLTGLDGDFNPARIERYLLLIQSSGIQPVVVLTKADTVIDLAVSTMALRERIPASIDIIAVNTQSAGSVAPLWQYLKSGSTVVLVGSSGAGKSTLTNTLLGETRQITNAVRANDSRGRHTTRHRSLIQLSSGACLIDTPGMREIKLTGTESINEDQFADIDALAMECRFGDCAHRTEPGCAVQSALGDGRLDNARWQNYLKLRDELTLTAATVEAQLKRKSQARLSNKALEKRVLNKYGQP